MAAFNFITVRLGKDSIPDIKQICSSNVGIMGKTFAIHVKCTQVPDNYGYGDYAFLWLGSDNNKGMPTDWKQGFKAVGRVKNVIRGKNYNDTSETAIEIVYIFKESVNRMDILRCAPTAYYWCSSMPLIGLDDHANQTIRNMTGTAFADLRAFFSAIDAVTNNFKSHILQIEPRFEQFFDYPLPNPQLFPNVKNLTEIGFGDYLSRKICPLQQIYYGAPGTGKSHTINEQTEGESVIRTTFHPDSDYSTFVGAYKPTMGLLPICDELGQPMKIGSTILHKEQIIYEFVDQAFLQAYVQAWKFYAENSDTAKKQYLIIEEINRGNCAQIFGDLFQLLDRNDCGFSVYPINADKDMKKQLAKAFKKDGVTITIPNADKINALYKGKDIVSKVLSGEILVLPNNLYIWATMNTSDQSLFPIDSAFKRRWEWQYMPIGKGYDENGQEIKWAIEGATKKFSWWSFLEKINAQIGEATQSEDKKLGFFFCKATDGVISAEKFVGKVIFYLWNDVFKNNGFEGPIFKDVDGTELSFAKFYKSDMKGNAIVQKDKVELFLNNLGVEEFKDGNIPLEEPEEDEDGNQASSPSTGRDYTKFSINGVGNYAKNNLAAECVKKYIELNPTKTAEEVLNDWRSLGNIVPHFIESKEQYDARTDNSKRSHEIACGGAVIYVAHNGYGNNGKVLVLMEAVNQKDWGITIQKNV